MTVTVPINAPGFQLQVQITNVTNLLAAATAIPAMRASQQQLLVALQQSLVNELMRSGAVPASAILSGLTYGQADTNVV